MKTIREKKQEKKSLKKKNTKRTFLGSLHYYPAKESNKESFLYY